MPDFRKLLFPFSVLYDGITALRNYAYDNGILSSTSYDVPVICVGNLSVGGTGKSPMIEYLVNLLKQDHKVAVLSRGYGRKTSGYLEVKTDHTAREVGDEPLQIKRNFPKVMVAVCGDRRQGIERLKPNADIILLDDAFQHRRVAASLNILLTSYHNLFINDLLLPAGNLRESRKGMKRADCIVVTKCPEGVAYAKLQEIQLALRIQSHQRIYFSKIGYDSLIYGISETQPLDYLLDKPFTLVTGIANPKPLVEFLKGKHFRFDHMKFQDHHSFSDSEIEKMKEKDIILTTQKDFMRLKDRLEKFAFYYLPIKTIVLNRQEPFFQKYILEKIEEH